MNQRLKVLTGEILLVASALQASCAAESAKSGTDTRPLRCDNVLLWSFSEELQLDSTATENRPYLTQVTQARVNSIALAAAIYCQRYGGKYPPTYTEMLRRASEIPRERAACRLADDLLDDAWGRPIYYLAGGQSLRVVSAGPDGRFATGDDIALPQPGAQHAERMDIAKQCARGPSIRP